VYPVSTDKALEPVSTDKALTAVSTDKLYQPFFENSWVVTMTMTMTVNVAALQVFGSLLNVSAVTGKSSRKGKVWYKQ
jgi:hypothetical protein